MHPAIGVEGVGYWRRNRRFRGGPPLALGRREEHHRHRCTRDGRRSHRWRRRRVKGELEKLEEKRIKGRGVTNEWYISVDGREKI